MLFHVFCEFADGSSKYLHLRAYNNKDAYRKAILEHYALQVLWILNSGDPFCKSLGLEYTPVDSEVRNDQKAA
jgi:hypothetical protein